MKARAVLRFELEATDQVHTIPAGKVVLFTEQRRAHRTERRGRVEVWVETALQSRTTAALSIGTQEVQIFGTGQLIPAGAAHLASALDGPLVWHLYQIPATP